MKKILLLSSAIALLFAGHMNAQITLLDGNGDVIVDEQEFEFGTTDEDPAKLHFYIQNNTSEAIGVKAEMISITNADGSEVEFCMGECLLSASEGTVVPENGSLPVAPNETTNSPGTYFWNKDTSNDLITYKFKVYPLDEFGGEAEGTATHITYTYDSSLSVSDPEFSENTTLYPTVTKGGVNIVLNTPAEVTIFNIQGKLVKSVNLESGNSLVNLSNLSSGVYLVKLKNENNVVVTKKIIKQ